MSTSKPPADQPRRGTAEHLSGGCRVDTRGLRWKQQHYDRYTAPNYTVGGTISGLTVSSVVLANGNATVTVAAGASSWVFPVSFAAGSSYSVTVKTQPAGEQCEVTSGGSGMEPADVGNVTVACGFGQWTWKGGLNTLNASGVYGTLGTAVGRQRAGGALLGPTPGPTRPATSGCSGASATTPPALPAT